MNAKRWIEITYAKWCLYPQKQIGNLNWVSEKPLQVSPSSNQAFLDNHKSILQNFENYQKSLQKRQQN